MSSNSRRQRHRLAVSVSALIALAALGLACARGVPETRPQVTDWIGSWSAPSQLTEPHNMPPAPGLAENTLRQWVRISVGGARLRVRLSNRFGDAPLTVRAASVARALEAGPADVSPLVRVTFAGKGEVTIAAGGEVFSDPVELALPKLARVLVQLSFGQVPRALTGHPGSRTTSFLYAGDASVRSTPETGVPVVHWYVLSGLEVEGGTLSAAVVTLGNSITDGRGSETDRNNRWPDLLAERLVERPGMSGVAVLNAGIGGNAVLRGGLGPTALERLERDVFSQRGVRWLIVSEGVNDIGGASTPDAADSVTTALIAAYQRILARAHRSAVKAYGATILPFGGSGYDSPAHERARTAVNQWIRTSGAWDAVIDFDAALRDSETPTRLRGDSDSGDHLHPNVAGYRRMAESIALTLFDR